MVFMDRWAIRRGGGSGIKTERLEDEGFRRSDSSSSVCWSFVCVCLCGSRDKPQIHIPHVLYSSAPGTLAAAETDASDESL